MKNETKTKVGIFALTMLAMSTLGITPSIGLIMEAFPEADATLVQQLTGIPNLMGILSAVVFGIAANKVPRKWIAVAAPALIAIGGLLPVVIDGGIYFLIVCSAILGAGVGLVTNTANLLITDLIDPERRQAVMAQNTIFVNGGSIFMTVVGGMLAAGGWKNNYLVYLIAIPVLILVLLCIPNYKADLGEAPAGADRGQTAEKPSLGTTPIVIGIVMFLYMCVYSTFPNNAALVLVQGGFGDPTLTGMIIAAGTVSGIVAGFTLDKVLKPIQNISLAFGLGMLGVGMLILGFANSVPLCIVAAVLIGYGLSFGFAQSPFVIAVSTAPVLISTAMAIFSAGASIGGFASPILTNMLSGMLMGGTAQGCCIVAAVISFIGCAALLLSGFQAKVLRRAFAPKED